MLETGRKWRTLLSVLQMIFSSKSLGQNKKSSNKTLKKEENKKLLGNLGVQR